VTFITPMTGAETRVAITAETTPGTTPVTPTMVVLPTVKIDLELKKDENTDNSIFSDRMERIVVAGISKVSGSFESNLSHINFAPIIQTAMFAAPVANVFKTGKVLNTITIEEWHSDTSVGFVSTGIFADKLSLKFPVKGFVTMNASLEGFNQTVTTTALSATPTVPVAENPFVMVSATLLEGGAAIAVLTAVDINIDNGATGVEVLGALTPVGYTPGISKVSGTISGYILNNTLINKFFNQTSTSISVQCTDGTNTLTFLLPHVVYTGLKKSVSGQSAVVFQMPFVALWDSVALTNLVITQS
jgi:hypothetical protein